MREDTLTENQASLLQHLKIKLMALGMNDVKVLGNADCVKSRVSLSPTRFYN
jgi:hypothetical protein